MRGGGEGVVRVEEEGGGGSGVVLFVNVWMEAARELHILPGVPEASTEQRQPTACAKGGDILPLLAGITKYGNRDGPQR